MIWTTVVLVGLPGLVAAHPPQSMDLEYDFVEKVVHIDLSHVVRNGNDHFIKTAIVTKNDEEPIKSFYRKQSSPKTFTINVPLEAEGGDSIHVKVICSDGGTKKASVDVIGEEETNEDAKDEEGSAIETQEKATKKGSGY